VSVTHDVGGRGAVDAHGRPYENVSFWLEEVGDLEPRASLPGDLDVDVAILGAGYTGLWTAYYLQEQDPNLRIAIIEREIAGYGPSGRNGGWCNASMIGVSPEEMGRRYGKEQTQEIFRVLRATVDEIGEVAVRERLDIDWRKAGVLRVAVGDAERPALLSRWRALEGLGLAEGCALLDGEETRGRIKLNGAKGAVYDPNVAFHQPAKLVRGLARVVESRGASIYEQTDVVGVETGPSPRLRTDRGDVRAKMLVLAGEAYMSQLPGWRRRFLPVYSLIALTEPLTDEQWDQIGWQGGECFSSHSLSVDYLSRTRDGRIVFGGRGAPYRFGSKVAPGLDQHEATHDILRNRMRTWFPQLQGVRFTHAWGGPLAVTRDWMPTFINDPSNGVVSYHGYAGQGVAPSNLAGRMLADAVTGVTDSPLLDLPLAKHQARAWEPEPFRWIGVRYVQTALGRLDRKSTASGRPPTGKSIAERLARH
jgi:glycine/D-amino acid oxidase-like deaminating enzyme